MTTQSPATDGWVRYMDTITGRAEGATIARITGIQASTVSNWRNAKREPTVDQVISVTRAYGRSPLEGFVQAGLLTPDEIGISVVKARVEDLTALELAAALHERLLEERDAASYAQSVEEPSLEEEYEIAARTIEAGELPGVDPQESA